MVLNGTLNKKRADFYCLCCCKHCYWKARTTMVTIDSLTDEEVVARIKAGEVDLFEILVHRYQNRLVNYIYRMINQKDTAMELCQEVFLKVFKSLKQYNPEYKFTTWIHRIASNATIDWIRKKKLPTYSMESAVNEDTPTLEHQLKSTALNPQESLEMSQLKSRIMIAIDELPIIYKELILLRHINHLSYDDIAKAVDLPLGTVKNRIFRGREMLKSALAEELKRRSHG
ncbi:MAG: RNA polymerase subunit sigma-24 [Acidobacteria bacterium]|nr:MAG: RNA polymerase subunit sigma-24 [Acidobacteriota bacterium]